MDLNAAESLLTGPERTRLGALLETRAAGKPLQYILGWQPFLGIPILVRRPILIPRWETEEMVSRLADELAVYLGDQSERTFRILDACSGSGCITLGLAHRLGEKLKRSASNLEVIGFDLDMRAVRLARFNQRLYRRLGHLQVCSPARVEFMQMDLFSDQVLERFEGRVDAIISNPPYIPELEWQTLDAGVRDWESRIALASADRHQDDPTGTRFHLRLAELAGQLLGNRAGPRLLVMETHGDRQSAELARALSKRAEMMDVRIWKDSAGIDRAIRVSF